MTIVRTSAVPAIVIALLPILSLLHLTGGDGYSAAFVDGLTIVRTTIPRHPSSLSHPPGFLLPLPTVQTARTSSGRYSYRHDDASDGRCRRWTPVAARGSGFDRMGLLAKKADQSEENSSLSSSRDGPKMGDESLPHSPTSTQAPQSSRIRRWWSALRRTKKAAPLQGGDSGRRRRRTVYVLECEGGKYFVGSTSNRRIRYDRHLNPNDSSESSEAESESFFDDNGDGGGWTKRYRPIRITKKYRRIPAKYCQGFESKITAEYMWEKGINNVRGAGFIDADDYYTSRPGDGNSDQFLDGLARFLWHYRCSQNDDNSDDLRCCEDVRTWLERSLPLSPLPPSTPLPPPPSTMENMEKVREEIHRKITNQLEGKLREYQAEIKRKSTLIENLQGKISNITSNFLVERDQLESTLKETKDATIKLEGRIDEVESELSLSNEEVVSLKDTINELESIKHDIDTENNDMITRLRDEISELTLEKNDLTSDMGEQLSSKNSELKKVKGEVDDLLERISTIKEGYDSEIDSLKNQHAKGISDQLMEKQGEQKKIEQEVEELLEKISSIEDKHKSEVEALENQHEQTNIQLKDASRELQLEIEQRSALIENFQGEIINLNRARAKLESDNEKSLAQSKHDDEQKIDELQQKFFEKDAELNYNLDALANKDFEKTRQDLEAQIKSLKEENHEITTKFVTEEAELESDYKEAKYSFLVERDQLESILKEAKDATIKLEGRIDEVESEISLSNEEAVSLKDAINELVSIKHAIDTENNATIVRLRDEISKLTLNKITLMSDMGEQLSSINNELKEAKEEANNLLRSISAIKESYDSEIDSLKNQHARDIGDQLMEKEIEQKKIKQEVEELLEKKTSIEDKHKSEIEVLENQHEQTMIQLEDASRELQLEIEQRSTIVGDLQEEIKNLNRAHVEVENTYGRKLAQSKHDDKQRIEELQQQIAEIDVELKCTLEDLADKDNASKLFEKARQDLEAQIKSLEEEKHEITTKFSKKRAELESNQRRASLTFLVEQDQLESALEQATNTITELEGHIDEVESKLSLSNEEAVSLKDTIEKIENIKHDINTENNNMISCLRDEISELTLEKNTLTSDLGEQLSSKNSELKEAKEEVNDLLECVSTIKESYNSEIDSLKNQHARDIGDQLVEKQAEQQKIKQEVEELLETISSIEDKHKSEVEALKNQHERTNIQLKDASRELQLEIEQRSTLIDDLQEEIKNLNRAHAEVENTFDRKLAQLDHGDERQIDELQQKIGEIDAELKCTLEDLADKDNASKFFEKMRQDLEEQIKSLKEEKHEITTKFATERAELESNYKEARSVSKALEETLDNLMLETSIKMEEMTQDLKASEEPPPVKVPVVITTYDLACDSSLTTNQLIAHLLRFYINDTKAGTTMTSSSSHHQQKQHYHTLASVSTALVETYYSDSFAQYIANASEGGCLYDHWTAELLGLPDYQGNIENAVCENQEQYGWLVMVSVDDGDLSWVVDARRVEMALKDMEVMGDNADNIGGSDEKETGNGMERRYFVGNRKGL